MENKVKTERLYNIELLRIIAMILIILTHAMGHGGVLSSVDNNSLHYYILNFIYSCSVISVNIFVLISGFFLCKSSFKVKKLLFLVFEVVLYSLLIYLMLVITKQVDFSFKELILSLFPIVTGKYWFITCYVLLYIFSPYLNVVINNISKKTHAFLIILCCVIFSIIPTVIYFVDAFNVNGGYSLIWFIVLYFIAAYIRNYIKVTDKKNWISLVIFASSTLLIFTSFIIIDKYFTFLSNRLLFVYNSILLLISSVSLLVWFLGININNKIGKTINFIAKYTLIVYLIHDNNLLRSILWSALNLSKYLNNGVIYIALTIVVISIFVVCLIIAVLVNFVYNKAFNYLYKVCGDIFEKNKKDKKGE